MGKFIEWLLEEPFKQTNPNAFIKGRDSSKRKAFLSNHTAQELTHHKLFSTNHGKAGYALDKSKDLQNVFNNSGKKGVGRNILNHAIHKGAKTLDAYDGFLPKLYAKHGFVETGRLKFNDEFAPKDWDYKKYGRPDIVFMAYKGGDRNTIEKREGKFARNPLKSQYHHSYDEAKRHQHFVAMNGDRQKPLMAKPVKLKEDMQNNIDLLVEQLPADAKAWVKGLNVNERVEINRLLRETGVDNFSRNWRDHKAELDELKNSFGRI